MDRRLVNTTPTGRPAGASIAGPMTMRMVKGLGSSLPLGMARSEPPIPMGTIGAPVRADKKVAPSMRSSITLPSCRFAGTTRGTRRG